MAELNNFDVPCMETTKKVDETIDEGEGKNRDRDIFRGNPTAASVISGVKVIGV